jgi:myo-inositol-1(or 4)-monophosphatase
MADDITSAERDKEIRARLHYGLKKVLPKLIPLIQREFPKEHRLLSADDNTIQPDIDTEEKGISVIKSRYPADTIIAEERSKRDANLKGNSPYGWVADFIDGSSNFRKKKPYFAINMSIRKGNEVLGGIICDPMYYKIFYVRKGEGVYLDGEPISVSSQTDLSKAHIGLISPNSFRKHNENYLMRRLEQVVGSERKNGSTSLELAACAAGEIDGVVKPTKNNWQDAGFLMVKEAGGRVTPIRRGSHTIYVASNPYIHKALCDVVRERSA